jgi:hypothetical protein
MIYQLNSKNFSLLYKTHFYRERVIEMSPRPYKHFILFVIHSQNRKKVTSVLFDFIKGRFQGKVVIPRRDICYTVRNNVYVGWHGIIVITCGRVEVYVTIYDSIESNVTGRTGYLNIILRNGIRITARSFSRFCTSKGGDLYLSMNSFQNLTVYRRQTRYEPVKHKIRQTRLFRNHKAFTTSVDISSDTFYIICLPGPVAIAFLNVYDPVDGIVEKDSGNNTTFREVIPSFHPPSKDTDLEHFYFSMDGSLLHFIRSPKKTLLSVNIYTKISS